MVRKSNIPDVLIKYLAYSDDKLEQLIKKYPYFPVPKVAYLLKNKNNDELLSQSELYLYDKKLVAYFLKENINIDELLVAHSTLIGVETGEKIIENEEKKSTKEQNIETSPVVKYEVEQDLILEATPQSTIDEVKEPSIKQDSIEFELENNEKTDKKKPLKEEIQASDFELDLTESEAEIGDNTEIEEVKKLIPKGKKGKEKIKKSKKTVKKKPKTKQQKSTKTIAKTKEIKAEDSVGEMGFFDWLNKIKEPIDAENSTLNTNENTEKQEKEKTQNIEIESEITETDDTLQQTYIQRQIEKRGVPNVKEKKSIDEDAQSSLKNPNLVTEAMAILYAQQENYEKSIEIYEKLIEKFPRKSTFFASQIEKLKK